MAVGNASMSAATNAGKRELVITHVFAAPRGLVFEAVTASERVKRWWKPNGWIESWDRLAGDLVKV
jgi:uncharacterized protein YndB with AHSA1/START domain